MSKRPLLALLPVLLAACSTEVPSAAIGPFKGDPAVAAQVAVNGGDMTVTITSQAFKVVAAAAATNKHQFGEGHYHLFLDVPPTAAGEVIPQGVNGIYHTADSPYVIHNVTNGHHTLWVELGFSDHLPYTYLAIQKASVSGALTKVEFDVGNGATAQASPSPEASPSAAASAAASPSAAASGPPAAGGTKVALLTDATNGGKYDPASITIKTGDSVTWDWQDDSASHTVTDDNGAFDSSSQSKGFTFSFKYDKAGTFGYSCTIHPAMKGSVTVQ